MDAPTARRDRHSLEPTSSGGRRAAVSGIAGPGDRVGHAATPGPLSPRPRHAIPSDRPTRRGRHGAVDGGRDAPRDGDDVLAAGGGGRGGAGGTISRTYRLTIGGYRTRSLVSPAARLTSLLYKESGPVRRSQVQAAGLAPELLERGVDRPTGRTTQRREAGTG